MKHPLLAIMLCAALLSPSAGAADAECQGNFVNPITDVCWECLFPISIGSVALMSGPAPDTSNPSMPIQICPMGILYRVGLAIGYWEPMALTDVTRAPLLPGQYGRDQSGDWQSRHRDSWTE